MEASGGKRGQKRVSEPFSPEQKVIDLSVDLLVARNGAVFGRGFRLRAIGQRLYVQVAGRKIPLYLDFDADPTAVAERALALRQMQKGHGPGFNSEAWRDACTLERVRRGKSFLPASAAPKAAPTLDVVMEKWQRLKRAEGVSDATIERHYLLHLRRLDPRHPLSEESLLRAIEQTDPHGPTRRRVVAFLRRLCALHGVTWNAALLDSLQSSGRSIKHRPQAFFSDEEIEAMLDRPAGLTASWRRVVALLAVYGLRPWEAWVAEPCAVRQGCVWIPSGKVNRHGATPPRQVPPFHPEWLERFDVAALMTRPLPKLSSPSSAGSRVNQQMRRAGLFESGGSTSYGFRHAYARRLHTPRYRVTDAHAALFMGHTVAAHHKAYRSWLGGEDPIGMYLDCPG
jgi:integrase